MGRAVRILPVVRIVAVVAVAIAPTTLVAASAGAAGLGRAATVAAASPTYSAGAITLSVVSARDVSPGKNFTPHKGDPVTDYQWIINADDTGNPGTAKDPLLTDCLPATAAGAHSSDPAYADTCPWPSTRPTSGFAPIVAEGDQADFAAGKPLSLPGGKYLISVKSRGFKIDGAHFTVDGGSQAVKVGLNPTPLPLATIQLQVYDDYAPVDGTFEVDAESSVNMSGFHAHLSDVFGTVSVDYYGNALCTSYLHDAKGAIRFDAANKPMVDTTKAPGCLSDSKGVIKIPNLGPNRYAATVAAPKITGAQWVQTTTLEGGHDHDIWIQEGDTGLDTEQLRGQEPVPATQFGFVKSMALARAAKDTTRHGGIKGVVVQGLPYIGGQNGVVGPEGVAGVKIGSRLANVWVALSDMNHGDQQVYLAKARSDGTFSIDDVADGSYQVTIWDDDQDYIIYSFNAEVDAAAHSGSDGYTDVGQQMLVGWFSHFQGHVFVDDNGNGKRDPGEQGVPSFALTLRERDNTLMDQATNTVTTNDQGEYDIREGYPMAKYLILEAFNTRYATTGVTWKGDNDPEGTTQLGQMVDLNVLPIIGLNGTVDWGVRPYTPSENGGIAATVSYDTTRNELDAADAASESYQPGIPDVKVHLYQSTPCPFTDKTSATYAVDVANQCRQGKEIVPLQNVNDAFDRTQPPSSTNEKYTGTNPDKNRGAFVKGPEVSDAYNSETWGPPRGCTARQWDGSELDKTIQQALPEFGPDANQLCVEAPMMGFQAGVSDAGGGSQAVNGNYGFSGMDPGDYIVSVDIPKTPVGDRPMYKVTSEEDVNVFTGDSYLPQENYPPSTQAAADNPADPPTATPAAPSQPPSQQAGIISSCVGPLHTVHVRSVPEGDSSDPVPGTYNPDFNAGGGSPFEGYDMPSCADKLVTVRSGQTVAPNFNLFTEVPIPTHFWGLTINDLGLTLDTRSIGYGEAQGLPYVPVGFYDWAGRLDYTAHTDFNGMYEALMPSTDTYNCPVPAGPCPNMYRTVGNDPGAPGALNPDYNSRFRTIAANFQGWPGLYTVTDQAPTQAASTVATPDGAVANNTVCNLPDSTPQLLSVSTPYVKPLPGGQHAAVTITGFGFGAARGKLTLKDPLVSTMPQVTANVTAWSDHSITFTVPSTYKPTNSAVQAGLNGALQLSLTSATGVPAYNTLSLLALSGSGTGASQDDPKLYEVGPQAGRYHTVQAALNDAVPTRAVPYKAVVVYPNTQSTVDPQGDYNENIVIHNQVRVQGVGPGGFDDTGAFVPGSIIDGTGFDLDLPSGTSWLAALNRQAYRGLAAVPDAADVTVLAPLAGTSQPPATGSPTSVWPVTLDGLRIRNGSQANIATAANAVTGGNSTGVGGGGSLVTQGGGVYAHQYVQGLHLTNNVFDGNSGSFGGAIRLGTPYVGNNQNYAPVISHNQIRDNGGTNLAGGIGLFTGSDGYSVDHNAICGNHSSEYGGAITAFGYQNNDKTLGPKNSIDHNRIWFNQSYDEGGAVMVAGELPTDPNGITTGSGPVSIDANVIQANLANDDGGGIRLLQTSGSNVATPNCSTGVRRVLTCPANRVVTDTVNITNNQIANNVSAHEGGGIALDDAAFVNIVDNTVVRNITTATATTSNGLPAPAGLSTGVLSDQLLARLKAQPGFASMLTNGTAVASPTMFNNVFSDNYAGTYYGGLESGITDADANRWDVGIPDNPAALQLTMNNSWYQNVTDTVGTGNVVGDDSVNAVKVRSDFQIGVNILASRQFPAFRQAAITTAVFPYSLLGQFDLAPGSAAIGLGAARMTAAYGTSPAFVNGTTPAPVVVTAPPLDLHAVTRPTAGRYDAGSSQATP